MAKVALTVETSDCSAVICAVAELADRLAWPHRENFRSEVQSLVDTGKAFTFETPARGATLEVLASAELLDLMRAYSA